MGVRLSDIATKASALTGTERLEVTQSGTTKYTDPEQINEYVESQASSANTPSALMLRDANGDTALRDVSARQVVIRGDTSGTATIKAPAAAGSPTFTLPSGTGSAGQFLQTNGSGVLSWAAASGSQYALIRASGPFADTPVSSYSKMTLNTEAYDPNNLVSLASSVFTLVAGTYILVAQTMIWYGTDEASGGAGTDARIRNTSDSTDVCVSANAFSGAYSSGGAAGVTADWTATLTLIGQVTIASSKNFELQARFLNSPTYIQSANTGNINQVLIVKV